MLIMCVFFAEYAFILPYFPRILCLLLFCVYHGPSFRSVRSQDLMAPKDSWFVHVFVISFPLLCASCFNRQIYDLTATMCLILNPVCAVYFYYCSFCLLLDLRLKSDALDHYRKPTGF